MSDPKLSNTLSAVARIITGRWLPPHAIHAELKKQGIFIAAEAMTARVRDLKKPQYGAFPVVKRRNEHGYYDYSIQPQRSLF